MWQECVLLRLVESMNFIHKQDRALMVCGATPFRRLHNLAQIGDPAGDSRKQDELGFRMAGNNFCQRRFAGPGRAPEDDG
jgi:hypothetical protein